MSTQLNLALFDAFRALDDALLDEQVHLAAQRAALVARRDAAAPARGEALTEASYERAMALEGLADRHGRLAGASRNRQALARERVEAVLAALAAAPRGEP